MAFLVEDGTGIEGANAGVSVVFADEYHALRGNVQWATFTEQVKQQLIVRATDYARDVFGQALQGVRVGALQGWDWPRTGVVLNSFAYPINAVPQGIKEALCELALTSKTTPLLVNVTRGKKMVKVGSLQVEYDGTSAVQTKFTAAVLKFAPYLASSASPSGINVKLNRV